MSSDYLVDKIKGTTFIRLFLLLSFGVVLSQILANSLPLLMSVIFLLIVFLISVVLYFFRQYHISIFFFYLLLVLYGYFLVSFDLLSLDKLSILNCQFSIYRDALIAYFSKRGITDDNLPLLSALILGVRSDISPSLVYSFRASGVAHILVVSGMHVGFLYMIIFYVIRRVHCKHFVTIIGILLLWFYALMVGATHSVCRAVFMFSVMLIMQIVGERYNSFHALFLSAFIQLLIMPSALFDIGFQLSYIAVLSILIFYPFLSIISIPSKHKIIDGTHASLRKVRCCILNVLSFLLNAIRLTLSAQILIAPLVAYYFGQFPLYFILTNLVTTLLVPIIFIAGFFALVPIVSIIIVPLLNMLLNFLQSIVTMISSLPMALVQVRLSLMALLIIYLLIILVVAYSLSDDLSANTKCAD